MLESQADLLREGIEELEREEPDSPILTHLRAQLSMLEKAEKSPAAQNALSVGAANPLGSSHLESLQNAVHFGTGPNDADNGESGFGEDDPPSIGDERGGETLVAMGDDFPDEWDDWLDSLVTAFADISVPCAEADLSVKGMAFSEAQTARVEFAEKIGVCIQRDFWEGDHTSGSFCTAWVKTTSIPGLKKKGKQLIRDIEKLALAEAKKALRERDAHADLEILLAKLTRDPIHDEETIRSLSRNLAEAEAKLAKVIDVLGA